MKSFNSNYQTTIIKPVTTLTTLWKLTLRNGTVMGFTSFSRDIEMSGVVYKARTGFSPGAIALSAHFNVDNLDIQGVLDDFSITEDDLNSGKYDFAEVEILRLNWLDKPYSYGKCDKIIKGITGEIKVEKGQYTTEVRSLSQFLQFNVGELVQPACPYTLGDEFCTKDLTDFTFYSQVTSVIDNRIIYCDLTQVDGFFSYGSITFNSGLNIQLSCEVKSYMQLNGFVELQLPANYTIEIGDTFTIYAGCNKDLDTDCSEKFDNGINHGGFPDLPGNDITNVLS